jgi:hypothetical protein
LTFTVRFGLTNMTVERAGVDTPNSGHHHLLVDTPLPPLDQPIPSDDNHLHFGAGQTDATITLTPGRHTLQLLLGDADHVPHDPPVYSAPVTVMVGAVARRKTCRTGEALNASGECQPREAAQPAHRPVGRRQADLPRFGGAPKRALRAAPEEVNVPAARAPAPVAGEQFNDFRRCPPGTHSETFPIGPGFRCAPDR